MTVALDEQVVAAAEIRAELVRILASPNFASSPQLTSFLRYVVDETLAGRSGRLKERTVACGALGRDTRFDPRLDCVVRVVAGKVRRMLEHFYALHGDANSVCIELPKGSYCPVFRAGTKPAPTPAAHQTLVAVTGGAGSNGAPRPEVAVLPLRLLTSGAKERLAAEILADDVAVRLGRLAGLEVIDCYGALQSHPRRENVCDSAARLHVEFIFAGTVSRVGQVVRLTARLIDGHNGALVWGEQFDRKLDNGPLAQQDDIADRIATSVERFFRARPPVRAISAGQ